MSIIIETSQGTRNDEEELPLGDAELATALGRLDGDRTTLLVDIARALQAARYFAETGGLDDDQLWEEPEL